MKNEKKHSLFHDYWFAFNKSYTWNLLKNHWFRFGFFWGIPVPVSVLAIGLWAKGQAITMSNTLEFLNAHPLLWVFPLHPFIFGFMFGAMGTIRCEKNALIKKLLNDLSNEARKDSLTGLANRRQLSEVYQQEIQRCQRNNLPLSLVLFDIDYFKKVNDTYGHHAGDIVLKNVAHILNGNSREYDTVARWGGEEFLALLPDSDAKNAEDFAERVRKQLEDKCHNAEGHKNIRCTLSAGITQCQPSEHLESALQRTDNALYQAKESGRNCSRKCLMSSPGQ